MKQDYVHLCVVLDASGSMEWIKEDSKGSFNNLIAEQKKTQGLTVLDVFQFSDSVEQIVKDADLSVYQKDLMGSYNCSGLTALNDAVCTAIDSIGKKFAAMDESERPEHVIFAIVTDGCENASKEYSLKDVKERIDRQTNEYSWEFIYLAANQDELEARKISRSMGVSSSFSSEDPRMLSDLASKAYCRTVATARMQKKQDGGKSK